MVVLGEVFVWLICVFGYLFDGIWVILCDVLGFDECVESVWVLFVVV